MSKFRVDLTKAHEKSGQSVYRVAQKTGLAYNTVRKYTDQFVILEKVTAEVAVLASHYGVDWHSVVEFIEDEGDTRPVQTIDDESEYVPPLAEPVIG